MFIGFVNGSMLIQNEYEFMNNFDEFPHSIIRRCIEMEDNIPEMTLLIESMNGAFTTESAVTNLGTDYEMSDEENSNHDEQIKFVFED